MNFCYLIEYMWLVLFYYKVTVNFFLSYYVVRGVIMVNSILLAISSSIDSLGIGITYGIKSTKISSIGKITLFTITLLSTYLSIFLGNLIQNIFPNFLTKLIGSFILIFMGIYIVLKLLKTEIIIPIFLTIQYHQTLIIQK